MRRQPDDRDRLRRAFRFEPPRRLPSVHHRQAHIHQDQIGPFSFGRDQSLLAIDRGHDGITAPGQPA